MSTNAALTGFNRPIHPSVITAQFWDTLGDSSNNNFPSAAGTSVVFAQLQESCYSNLSHSKSRRSHANAPTTPLGSLSDETESICSHFDLTSSSAPSLTLSVASAPSLQAPQFTRNNSKDHQDTDKRGLTLMRNEVSQPTSMPTSVPQQEQQAQQEPQQPTSPAAAPGTPAGSTTATEDVRKNEPIIQRNVYISGLPSYMQSHEFRELCQRFGRVEASKLCVEGPSNPTKGYGFVLYYSEESAAACIKELSGSYLNGRCLQARLADTHATPHEVKKRVVPPMPPPPPPPFPHMDHGAPLYVPILAPVATTVNYGYYPSATASVNTSLHTNMPSASMVAITPQGPMHVLQPGNTFLVNHNPQHSLSAGNSVNGSTVYYTCAAPQSCSSGALGMQAYRISPMPNSAERQQVVLLQQPPQPQPQPQQTIVYAASPAYFTAAGGAPSGHATAQNASVGSQAHVLSPLMLSGNPSNGVQFISLAPSPGSMPM